MSAYASLFLIVVGVNLLPAFGPPTWTIVALYGINSHLPVPAIVGVSAVAAALGRFLLALIFSALGGLLPDKWSRNLGAARDALEGKRRGAAGAVALFSLSPLPSAQLFEAAGLARLKTRQLIELTLAFFVGRTVSYSLYAWAAKSVRETSLGEAFKHSLTNPVAIGLEVLMLVLLALLLNADWARILNQK